MYKGLELAKKVSVLSDHPQHKLGAAILYKKNVISLGCNKYKTHPKSPHQWKYLHAEVVAVLKANQDVRGSDIYVWRETKGGIPACAKPCSSCMAFLIEAGIKRIFYSDTFGITSITL